MTETIDIFAEFDEPFSDSEVQEETTDIVYVDAEATPTVVGEAMCIAHPAVYWAKFLLSKRAYTYQAILSQMTLRGLGGLSVQDLANLDNSMKYPKPFLPVTKKHKPSMDFLRSEEIYDLWHQNKDMKQALEVFDSPKMRQTLEVLIIGPFRSDKAVAKLNRSVGIELDCRLTEDAYTLFRHYFWNPEFMSGADWGDYVRRSDRANKDLVSIATNVTSANTGHLLLWKMGIGDIRRVEGHKGYVDIRASAIAALAQIAHEQPSKEHAQMMLNYARVFDLAHKGIEATGGAQEDAAQNFRSFQLRHKTPNVKPATSLPGGNLMLPEVASAEDSDDE